MIGKVISGSLSRKVLIMAIGFVMIAEMLIFIPSAAFHRQEWLDDRAAQAGHLTLALTGVPDFSGSEMLAKQFMKDTNILMLSTKREGRTELILGLPPDSANFQIIDIREAKRVPSFRDTFSSFFGSSDGHLRVLADPLMPEHEYLEYIVPKASLQAELRSFSRNILLLSLAIAIITGSLLYLALSMVIVNPVAQLADALSEFRRDPDSRASNVPDSGRRDEIGQLQREFSDMKQSVRASLKQQDRLAALGLAVAKINHDLRNVLTSAQLVSDRIAMDKDERVANMGQRLVRAVDRGVKLCAEVLNFSQASDEPPELQFTRISLLIGEAAGDVLDQFSNIQFKNNVPSQLALDIDPDHTYRIFHNIFRNAAQAMSSMSDDLREPMLTVKADIVDGMHEFHIIDNGPGLPEKARNNLFKAFASSSGSQKSTGLGLTISKELAKAQGGDLRLSNTGEDGTIFTLTLPEDVDSQT